MKLKMAAGVVAFTVVSVFGMTACDSLSTIAAVEPTVTASVAPPVDPMVAARMEYTSVLTQNVSSVGDAACALSSLNPYDPNFLTSMRSKVTRLGTALGQMARQLADYSWPALVATDMAAFRSGLNTVSTELVQLGRDKNGMSFLTDMGQLESTMSSVSGQSNTVRQDFGLATNGTVFGGNGC